MYLYATTAVLAAWLPSVIGQFVSPPTDLINTTGYAGVPVRYKEVPTGICEMDPNVKSYSGYADVSKNQHIFFWFFEAREVDPTSAPLSVWINGGPGSSSMIGLFQELGPCGVDSNGNVYNNPYSWSTKSNMIFVDQPQTVGLSYTIPIHGYLDENDEVHEIEGTGCPANLTGQCGTYSINDDSLVPNSTASAAPIFWKVLQGFMGAFPQYSRNGFHFTTESYGGHYGPVFNEYFEQQNANLPSGAMEIHLESVMIGNGWYDPIIQYTAYYNFTVFPGNTYDDNLYNDSIKTQLYNDLYGKGGCIDMLQNCKATGNNTICSDADNFCADNIEEVYDEVLGRDEYDFRELTPDPFPYDYYPDYLNTPEVQKAVGAFTNFTDYSATVGDAFGSTGDDGREDMTIEDVQALLKQGIYVVEYYGDADYICNWLGGQVVAQETDPAGMASAGFANISTADCVVHGQVKQAGLFAFVRIYEAGHEVPFYQPLVSLEMFNRVINGTDIETGQIKVSDGYITTGSAKSTYREGNATVQYSVLSPNATYNTTTNEPNPPT